MEAAKFNLVMAAATSAIPISSCSCFSNFFVQGITKTGLKIDVGKFGAELWVAQLLRLLFCKPLSPNDMDEKYQKRFATTQKRAGGSSKRPSILQKDEKLPCVEPQAYPGIKLLDTGRLPGVAILAVMMPRMSDRM